MSTRIPVLSVRLMALVVVGIVAGSPSRVHATDAAPSTSPAPTPLIAQTPKFSPTPHDLQLADEIIRRLRRLGINLNPARLARPYDPEGELC